MEQEQRFATRLTPSLLLSHVAQVLQGGPSAGSSGVRVDLESWRVGLPAPLKPCTIPVNAAVVHIVATQPLEPSPPQDDSQLPDLTARQLDLYFQALAVAGRITVDGALQQLCFPRTHAVQSHSFDEFKWAAHAAFVASPEALVARVEEQLNRSCAGWSVRIDHTGMLRDWDCSRASARTSCLSAVVDTCTERGIDLIECISGEVCGIAYGEESMAASVLRAVDCANQCIIRVQQLQQHLPRQLVALHAQVAVGSVEITVAGSCSHGWRYLLDGSCHVLDQLEALKGLARQYQVILSSEAADLLPEPVTDLGDFTALGQCRLDAQEYSPLRRRATAAPCAVAERAELLSSELCSSEMYESVLCGLLPGLNIAHARPTSRFINGLVLLALQISGVHGLAAVQSKMDLCCGIVHSHSGTLLHATRSRWVSTRTGRTPPGLCTVFVFGYPMGSRADNMQHAWDAAFALNAALAEQSLVSSIGIAYGAVHLQQLGEGAQQQPRVAFAGGWLLEAALTLMHAAGNCCGIFADRAVAEHAGCSCGVAAERELEGWVAGDVEAWQLHPVQMPSFVKQQFEQPSLPSVQMPELQELLAAHRVQPQACELLRQSLNAFSDGRGRSIPSLVVIDGFVGMGKTSVLHDLKAAAIPDAKLTVVEATAKHATRHKLLNGAAGVVVSLLALGSRFLDRKSQTRPVGWQDHVQQQLREWLGETTAGQLAPYLNAVAGTSFDVSHELTNLDTATFERRLSSLIVRMVHNKAHEMGTKLVILVDDGQWLDGASWRLLDSICSSSTAQILICVALNSWGAIRPPDVKPCRIVRLHPAGMQQVEEMICQIAGSTHVDPSAVGAVQSWALGCPLAIHEVTRAMTEQGILTRNTNWQRGIPPGGVVNLEASAQCVDRFILPARLLDAAQRCWCELDAQKLQILKIASVFGRVVPFDGLIRACPPSLRAAVPAALEQMHELQLVGRVKSADRRRVCYGVPVLESRAYEFLSMYVLVAAYQLLEPKTKRDVHAQLAESLCREDSLDGWHELEEVRHDTTPLWIYHSVRAQQHASWSFLTYQQNNDERLRQNVIQRGLKRFHAVENWCILRRADGPVSTPAKHGQPGLSSLSHVPWMGGELFDLLDLQPAAVSAGPLDLSALVQPSTVLDGLDASKSPQTGGRICEPSELQLASFAQMEPDATDAAATNIGVAVDYLTYGVQVVGAVLLSALMAPSRK